MKRFDCIKILGSLTGEQDLVVTNLGNTAHEWDKVRPSRGNLFSINLGQCTGVALGLALALPHRRVTCLDGDGNLLLNLVALADAAYQKPANLRIVVFDNQAYESPGGMPTATARGADLAQIAKGCGIENSATASTLEDFEEKAKAAFRGEGMAFLVAKIETGTIPRSQYQSMDHKFNKYQFASYIEETEKKPVLRLRATSPFTDK